MKIFLVSALGLISLGEILGTENNSPSTEDRDGGAAVSPTKKPLCQSRLENGQVEGKLPTPAGSVASCQSVGTAFGASDKIAEALTDIGRGPETSYAGCRALLELLHAGDIKISSKMDQLQVWHGAYFSRLKALSVIVGFVYAQRPTLSEEGFTRCKTHVRDVLLMTVGLQVLDGGQLRDKLYNRPEDAQKKWCKFFTGIKSEFPDAALFPNDRSLMEASKELGVELTFHAPVMAVESTPRTSSCSDGAPAIASSAQSKEDIIRDLWYATTGRSLYGVLDGLSQFWEVLSYNPGNLLSRNFATISMLWNEKKPNLLGMETALRNYDRDPNIRVLCSVSFDELICVLKLNEEDAGKRWNAYKKNLSYLRTENLKLMVTTMFGTIKPREILWDVYFKTKKEELGKLIT